MLTTTLSVYYFSVVAGIFYNDKRFNEDGLSKQYRNLIKRRHIYFVLLMICCSTTVVC